MSIATDRYQLSVNINLSTTLSSVLSNCYPLQAVPILQRFGGLLRLLHQGSQTSVRLNYVSDVAGFY